jgi:hypothetical protein
MFSEISGTSTLQVESRVGLRYGSRVIITGLRFYENESERLGYIFYPPHLQVVIINTHRVDRRYRIESRPAFLA